jgi:hypothetical protein
MDLYTSRLVIEIMLMRPIVKSKEICPNLVASHNRELYETKLEFFRTIFCILELTEGL